MSLYDYMSTKLFFVCGIPNFDRHLHVLNLFKLFFSVYHGKSRLNHDMAEYLLELLPGTQKANPRWSIGILRWELDSFLGGGFKYVFIFTLNLGEDSHFDKHSFQMGLVPPPTSFDLKDGWSETLAYIRKIWTSEGPFDGMLGFSQGGMDRWIWMGRRWMFCWSYKVDP